VFTGSKFQDYEQLELEGAAALGRVMFAFGRLENSLGLAVRSVDGGKYLDGTGFQSRLKALVCAVDARALDGGFDRAPYDSWIARADNLRGIRNDLVHGRWVPDAASMTVLNVVTTEDLSDQVSKPYSVNELSELATAVTALHKDLNLLVRRGEL
jgi:hypothetical protein